LLAFPPDLGPKRTPQQRQQFELGKRLVREASDLISSIARARVPMPKSTDDLIARCRAFSPRGAAPAQHYRTEAAR
jgi:hypothetical protein